MDDTERDMSTWPTGMAEKMRLQGKTLPPQRKHTGSSSGQKWEPDQATKDRLGDAYGITKEIIEEP